MTRYLDMGDSTEDDRLAMIGHSAIVHKETVGFVVENTAKAKRYVERLKELFPTIRIVEQFPFHEFIVVKVGPPVQ